MNKLSLILSVLLFLGLTSFTTEKDTQITDANYLKEDSLLWHDYEENVRAIYQQMKEHPEKADSLKRVSRSLYHQASVKNVELALKYFMVPSGLHRVYMIRNYIGKETLKSVLIAMPDSLRNHPYVGYIRDYVETHQLTEGDRYVPFDSQTISGEKFDWESMEKKNLLLLYGGLSCMGKSGQDYLKNLLEKTSRKDLEIVIFCTVSDLDDLQKIHESYPEFTLISNFQIEGNPMNIIYNAQATPTCFMIDRKGIIQVRSEGLNTQRFDAYLKSDGCLK